MTGLMPMISKYTFHNCVKLRKKSIAKFKKQNKNKNNYKQMVIIN